MNICKVLFASGTLLISINARATETAPTLPAALAVFKIVCLDVEYAEDGRRKALEAIGWKQVGFSIPMPMTQDGVQNLLFKHPDQSFSVELAGNIAPGAKCGVEGPAPPGSSVSEVLTELMRRINFPNPKNALVSVTTPGKAGKFPTNSFGIFWRQDKQQQSFRFGVSTLNPPQFWLVRDQSLNWKKN